MNIIEPLGGIEEEKHSLWFALALAQWETKSLDPIVLSQVEQIVTSRVDLAIWRDLGANETDIQKREKVLDDFLEKIKTERPKPKPRKRLKQKTPIFSTGDCLVFKMKNGNYGGAIVLASYSSPEVAYNLVATTRSNQITKPTIGEFKNAEILICNFANWDNKPDIAWRTPGFYHKNYAHLYEIAGNVEVNAEYDIKNYFGQGYLFKPSFTANWYLNETAEMQFESELTKPKPTKMITLKEVIQ